MNANKGSDFQMAPTIFPISMYAQRFYKQCPFLRFLQIQIQIEKEWNTIRARHTHSHKLMWNTNTRTHTNLVFCFL